MGPNTNTYVHPTQKFSDALSTFGRFFVRAISISLYLVALIHAGTELFANPVSIPEERPVLERRISINAQNQTLESILRRISDESGVLFSYNPDQIPISKPCSLNVQNKSVAEVLQTLLPHTKYKYKVISRTIVITPGKNHPSQTIDPQKKQKVTITGYVYDLQTGKRITSATVFDIHKLKSALTDNQGSYSLPVNSKEGNLQLSISKKGYWDTVIFVRPNEVVDIPTSLRPKPEVIEPIPNRDASELSEIRTLNDLGIVRSATPASVESQQENLTGFTGDRIGQISLLPGLGTNRKMNLMIQNKVSFNVLAGYSQSTRGLEIGGILNMVRENAEGLQIGGFGNVVGEKVDGIQIGGFFNHCVGKVHGVQLAGFSNTVLDTLKGIQIGGFMNIVRGKVKGIQFAGFSNVVTKSVDGAQISGFVNIALDSAGKVQFAGFGNYGRNLKGFQAGGFGNINLGNGTGYQFSGFANYNDGDFTGVQSAGFANLNRGNLKGAQFAGFANINTGDIEGFQIAGFVNKARKVKGSLFAFINIADTVTGLPIGFFNFIRKGYHVIEVHNSEFTYANATFKTGTKKFYNILSYGEGKRENHRIWMFGYGVGHSQTIIKDKLYADLDLATYQVNYDDQFNPYFSILNKVNLGVSVRVLGPIYLCASASYNVYIHDPELTFSDTFLYGKTITDASNKYAAQNWVGYNVGIRI